MSPQHPSPDAAAELERLRERVAELEDTLGAIRLGQVDALVDGNDLFTLESAESASNRFRGHVLQQISDTVIAVDNDLRITYLNEAAERQYGRPAAEVLGIRLNELYTYQWVDPDDEAASTRALQEHGEWRGENIHVKQNGDRLHMESVVRVINDTEGTPMGLLAVMRDITERVRTREALRDASRQKDHFLATLAHELRNPLSPIMNGLQLLDPDAAAEDLLALRDMMQRQLGHLVRLVDDLMDLGRITRGKLELRREEVDLATVAQAAVETSRPMIDQHGHRLVVQVEGGPFPVSADRIRLAQILSNLLNNAAKYTPAGGTIHLQLARAGGEATVSVADNGIGIHPDQLGRIFDMFAQLNETKLDGGGLGIGLNLAQRLTTMHGGTLTAQSGGPGAGSTFTLHLPMLHRVTNGVAHPPATARAEQVRPLRILVADDNEDATTTMGLMLRKAGHRVELVFNGSDALRVGADLHPELIFMDLGMAVMDGYETCARMRATPWGRQARIVAVSGWGQPQDRERSRQAGFDEHLVKPIDLACIRRMVQQAAEVV